MRSKSSRPSAQPSGATSARAASMASRPPRMQRADGGGVGRGHAGSQLGEGRVVERRQAVELHEVGGVVRVEHRRLPRLRRARAVEQRAQRGHRGHRERELIDASRGERLGEQADDLGVRLRALLPQALDAHLRELAGALPGVGVGLAKDALGVAEAQRPGLGGQARGAHAGHLEGDVRAHGQKLAARVEELEGSGGDAPARLQDAHDLERRGLHGQVAASGEEVLHRARDDLTRRGLLGQHVPESGWGDEIHRSFLLLAIKRSHGTRPRPPRTAQSAEPNANTAKRAQARTAGTPPCARRPSFAFAVLYHSRVIKQ